MVRLACRGRAASVSVGGCPAGGGATAPLEAAAAGGAEAAAEEDAPVEQNKVNVEPDDL